jgi:hypothetical protein
LHDGLWNEVQEAVGHAQATGHTFFAMKRDPEHSKSERATAKEAYTKAKSQLTSLLSELKIVELSEPAAPEEVGEAEAEAPAAQDNLEEDPKPNEPGPSSWGEGSTS